MKILYVAEVVGKPGIFVLKSLLSKVKKSLGADLVLGNADGATGGWGLGKNHAFYLHKLGLKGIAGGDSFFFKKDLQEILDQSSFLVRPANYPPGTPGKGLRFIKAGEEKVAFVSLLGQGGFSKIHLPSPLQTLEHLLDRFGKETPYWVVDYHGTTTAEKNSFFYAADGLVSAVIGSHQKVQTADARILTGRTGVITDAGRTGSARSVGGFLPETEIQKFLTGVPERSRECWDALELQGVLLELDRNGKVQDIKTIKEKCEEKPNVGDSGEDGRGPPEDPGEE